MSTASLAEEFSISDPWYRQPQSVTELFAQQPIAENGFTRVKEEKKAKALALLEANAFHPVTPAEAKEYGAQEISSGNHYYLVRAITLNRPHGVYSLYSAGDALLVRYSTMGNAVPPTAHDALVVSLPQTLKELYVIYHVVQ